MFAAIPITVLTVNKKYRKENTTLNYTKATQSYSIVHTTTEHKTQNTEQHDRDAQCRDVQCKDAQWIKHRYTDAEKNTTVSQSTKCKSAQQSKYNSFNNTKYTASQKVDHQLMVITLSKPDIPNPFTVGNFSKINWYSIRFWQSYRHQLVVHFLEQCTAWFMVCIKNMNAKSITINKMFYFSAMINIKECNELSTDTFAISH